LVRSQQRAYYSTAHATAARKARTRKYKEELPMTSTRQMRQLLLPLDVEEQHPVATEPQSG
jgi:hypothetical protein